MSLSFSHRILVALALTGSLLLAPATAAEAAPKKPGKATKVRAKATTSTLTIRWKRPKRATSVSICVKTKPKTKRCIRKVRTRKKVVKFRYLKPNSGNDFYYQLRSHRGKRSTVTKWRKVNLRVGNGPRNQGASHGSGALMYSWSGGIKNASSYQIQVWPVGSPEDARIEGRYGRAANITGLNGGMTYFARVRGANGTTKGAWGPTTRTRIVPTATRTTVATYNLCGENKCRTSTSGDWFLRNVPAWATRKPFAGALIRSAAPDIIATQESATKTAFHQVLPGYTRGAYKSAKQIYFKSSKYTNVDGGWMTLDPTTKRYATWNLLRDRQTGTAFIVANAHLEPYKGVTKDQLRDRQTGRLISKINALNQHNLPVIWAGDWNSNASNANQSTYPGGFDAPKSRFDRIGVVNSLEQAQDSVNSELNSANQGVLAPKSNGHHVDAIYVPRSGIEVEFWTMLANFTETEDGREYAAPFPSDHNPVVARLVLTTG